MKGSWNWGADMALKITLKPHEKMIVGNAVLANANAKSCDLLIENNVPILRQKDVLNESEATSPCRRIYFVIQLMYIEGENLVGHQKIYWQLVQELIKAAPSMTPLIDQINEEIVSNRFYQALKLAKCLIDYEQEVVNRV